MLSRRCSELGGRYTYRTILMMMVESDWIGEIYVIALAKTRLTYQVL